jgi:hypothetical protein
MPRPRSGETLADARDRWSAEVPHANGTSPGTRPAAEPKRPRSPSRRKPSAASVEKVVGGLLGVTQEMALQQVPALREDELSAEELGLLSKATAAEILGNKWALEWYMRLIDGTVTGPHSRMAATVMLIALPRLVRHGVIPAKLGGALFSIVATVLFADDQLQLRARPGGPGAIPPAPGGAHRPDREDGLGEVGIREGAPGAPEVPDFLQEQAGRNPLVDGPDDEEFEVVPQRAGGHPG